MMLRPWRTAMPRSRMPGFSMPHSSQRSIGTHTPPLVIALPSPVSRTTRSLNAYSPFVDGLGLTGARAAAAIE